MKKNFITCYGQNLDFKAQACKRMNHWQGNQYLPTSDYLKRKALQILFKKIKTRVNNFQIQVELIFI